MIWNGYGKLSRTLSARYGTTLAHRAAWIATHGDIPAGLCVCHRCDNRRCIRPDHLFLGTATDNLRDALLKGRLLVGEERSRLMFRIAARGAANANAKLTPEAVRAIRASADGPTKLAPLYGVSAPLISAVKRGKIWRHVDG